MGKKYKFIQISCYPLRLKTLGSWILIEISSKYSFRWVLFKSDQKEIDKVGIENFLEHFQGCERVASRQTFFGVIILTVVRGIEPGTSWLEAQKLPECSMPPPKKLSNLSVALSKLSMTTVGK